MPIPKRFVYPAILAACGIASFAIVLAVRWPGTMPDRGSPNDTRVEQRQDADARQDIADGGTVTQPTAIPGFVAPELRGPHAINATAEPETVDVTREPTDVMLPVPMEAPAYVEPVESAELVEGEPVAPLR